MYVSQEYRNPGILEKTGVFSQDSRNLGILEKTGVFEKTEVFSQKTAVFKKT